MRTLGLLLVSALLLAVDAPGNLTFTLPSTVPDNAEVTVHATYPLDANGAIDATAAADIVYYQGWWDERAFFEKGVFQALAKARFTVVGIFFEGAQKELEEGNPINPTTGSLDVIAAAIDQVRARLHLAVLKPFGCGHSSGGTAVYWAARAKSDFFEAIAPISGNPPPCTAPPALPMLHVQTWGDTGRIEASLAWHRALQVQGLSTMFTPPPMWEARDSPIWLHLNSQPSVQTAVAWLRALADVRRSCGGELPPPQAWPVQALASQVRATAEPAGGNRTRPMPSAEVANRIAALHRDLTERTDTATGARIVIVSPRQPPTRVVVVVPQTGRPARQAVWDAALAAEKGAIGVAISSSKPLTMTDLARMLADPAILPASSDRTVIAAGDQAPALTGLPDALARRIAIEPGSGVLGGTIAVVTGEAGKPAAAGTITVTAHANADMCHQRLLSAALAACERPHMPAQP